MLGMNVEEILPVFALTNHVGIIDGVTTDDF